MKLVKGEQTPPVPPLWVTLNYLRGPNQIAQISLVWENETPEQMRDNATRMAKEGGWYRLGNLNSGIVLFPASAVLDINIRLATPTEIQTGRTGVGAAKIP